MDEKKIKTLLKTKKGRELLLKEYKKKVEAKPPKTIKEFFFGRKEKV